MNDIRPSLHIIGRGAQSNPDNRFHKLQLQAEYDQLDADDELLSAAKKVTTDYFEDNSQSILWENNSPDIPFRYSLNPYRGCAHGWAYCYARPTHEYLGLSAGVDFESKIFIKTRAAELLRAHLSKPSWRTWGHCTLPGAANPPANMLCPQRFFGYLRRSSCLPSSMACFRSCSNAARYCW